MYVITGGNTGSVVAERLLEADRRCVLWGATRSGWRNSPRRVAESFIADATEGGALTNAFAGAKALYAMIPPILVPGVRAYMKKVRVTSYTPHLKH